MPVAASDTVNGSGALRPFDPTTTAVAVPDAVSYGSCALICPAVTASSGAATPFTSIDAPVRFDPKIENNPPGAMGAVKLAAFTIPPALMVGVAPSANFRIT